MNRAKVSAALTAAVMMVSDAALAQSSNPVLGAANWVRDLLMGAFATTVAVIAVAMVGFMMLTGRMNWKHGAIVILGLFILFGAPHIVARSKRPQAHSDMAGLVRTPVFKALTQPQMFAGVTYSYFIVNGVVTTEAFLITHSLWSLAVALVVHGIGYLACLREPRIFDLWLIKGVEVPSRPQLALWRCNSYGP